MKTKGLDWTQTEEAVAAIKRGDIVVFPTETVYGIGALPCEEGCRALQQAKGRPADKPFTLMCSSLGDVARYCEINVGVVAVMKEFMPGQITLLLKARKGIDPSIDFGSGVVGVRVPAHAELLKFLEGIGSPLLVSSANVSGSEAATSFAEAQTIFGGVASAIINGPCVSKVASTIVDLTGEQPRLVRQGNVPMEQIERVFASAKVNVSLGSDHGGFLYKEEIKKHLQERGFGVTDFGCDSTASCDYPVYGKAAAEAVRDGAAAFGVVVCTSGIGISIAANKVEGIRCAVAYDDVVVAKSREHNNANVIAFGQKYMALEDVLRRVDIFLCEKFSLEEKHHRRVAQL